MVTWEDLAQRLANLVSDMKLKQREIAAEVGITPAAISRILDGQREPGIEMVAAIVKACGRELRISFDLPGSTAENPIPPKLENLFALLAERPPEHIAIVEATARALPPLPPPPAPEPEPSQPTITDSVRALENRFDELAEQVEEWRRKDVRVLYEPSAPGAKSLRDRIPAMREELRRYASQIEVAVTHRPKAVATLLGRMRLVITALETGLEQDLASAFEEDIPF